MTFCKKNKKIGLLNKKDMAPTGIGHNLDQPQTSIQLAVLEMEKKYDPSNPKDQEILLRILDESESDEEIQEDANEIDVDNLENSNHDTDTDQQCSTSD
ncbi:hypothetical protein FQA39_LY01241 [Lamprigera yunnana]|nr:hypothetical protein FQA39_LY01241 [Lamprigera yunnana]